MEQVHKGRIDHVMKSAIETVVYRRRKRNSMSFGEKIGLVYENCEVLRYNIRRMEEYLGIKKEFLLVLLGKKKIFWKDIFLANFGTN